MMTLEKWDLGGFKCDAHLEVKYNNHIYRVPINFQQNEIYLDAYSNTDENDHKLYIINYVNNHFIEILYLLYDLHIEKWVEKHSNND